MLIAGVVVLYNPDYEVLNNIKSYLDELDCLYVCDNSDIINECLVSNLKKLPRVKYVSFGQNKGISYALNIALNLAKGYDFLLTMDQDSNFCSGMMHKYRNIILDNYIKDDTVAMFSVNYLNIDNLNDGVEVVERAITSGSILNIKIAKEIGGFDENLFIDEVDYEFCYRANAYGYKILYFKGILLQHNLGSPIKGCYLGKQFTAWNHNAIRKYYIARNNIYIMKKYPEKRKKCLKAIVGYFAKTVLIEPDKCKRILFMIRGIRDGIIGRMGKLNE